MSMASVFVCGVQMSRVPPKGVIATVLISPTDSDNPLWSALITVRISMGYLSFLAARQSS